MDDDDDEKIVDKGLRFCFVFVLYAIFGIVILVALNNIFIGKMGNMFDVNEDRAMRLLVRRRAFVAFECMLLRSTKELRKEQTKHLWICLGKEEQAGPDTAMRG